MKENGRLALLGGISVVLMSLPWLVPHTGFLALFGLVPLLLMEELAFRGGRRRFWLWHYGVFVLWNAATTFWVCNATVGGGIFAMLANALQMSVVFGIFHFSRRKLKGFLPYALLAALWIAWERWYFGTQISWPWLVLGNAFARSTRLVQWYEYTGTLGGSLWIWASNLAVFFTLKAFASPSTVRVRAALGCGTVLLLLAPAALSLGIYSSYEERSDAGELAVGIIQPNLDPYEKFESLTQAQQNRRLLSLAAPLAGDRDSLSPYLLLAPETFTGDVVLNDLHGGATWKTFDRFLSDKPGVNILYGASTYEFFRTRSAPSLLARASGNGWVESHNSALIQDGSGRTGVFHKSKLVVGTELTPYPKIFVPLDDKLGGVMGRCIGQDEVSLLEVCDSRSGTRIPLGCAVCYESVYGEYCTSYVRKGAQAMTVITNDAWWGNTPGYRQHLSYSALRAIELRRDIARCGNTGISAFINQRGDIVERGPWWEQAVLSGKIKLSGRQTAFVRYGDVTGRMCSLVAVLLLLVLLVSVLTGRDPRRA